MKIKPVRERFSPEQKGVKIDELIEYTGLPAKEVIDKSNRCRQALADEWNEKNPQTIFDTTKFYTETEWYIYDLFTWTHDELMWKLFDEVMKPGMEVLDYGCGIGDIAIYLAEKGCKVSAIDLPKSKTFHFCKWRVYKRMLVDKIDFMFEPDGDKKYDAVLAIDVLEHVYHPLRYVVQLCDKLKSDQSFMFITPTFADAGIHPMHLKTNFWLAEHFMNAMISLGLKPENIIERYFPIWHPMFTPPPEGQPAVSSSGSETTSPSSPSPI